MKKKWENLGYTMKESQIKIINIKKRKQIKFNTKIVKKGHEQMQRTIRFPKFFSELIQSEYDEIAISYCSGKFYIKSIESVYNDENYIINKISLYNNITIPRKICRQKNINLDEKTHVEYTYDYCINEIYFELK